MAAPVKSINLKQTAKQLLLQHDKKIIAAKSMDQTDKLGIFEVYSNAIQCNLFNSKYSHAPRKINKWKITYTPTYLPECGLRDSETWQVCLSAFTLQWRHNGCDSVSNHQPHDCLLNRLFRRRSKKTSNLRVTRLCVGNSPGTGEFPAQGASNAENVSIWWRHHVNQHMTQVPLRLVQMQKDIQLTK